MAPILSDIQHDRRPLRLACLGGGYYSAIGRCHNAALSIDHRFEVMAGCFDLDPEANVFSAMQYGVSRDRTYSTIDELLRNESSNVDAFVILTPTDQHAAHVIQCLERRVPVICEKALAVSIDEARKIEEALASTNGFLAVIYNYLGYPMVRELRAMIAAGRLGTVSQIHVEMPQEGFLRCDEHGEPVVPQDWRLRDHDVPTISLDLAVHLHAFVNFLTHETPMDVAALAGSFGNFRGIIDNVFCISQYSGALQCSFWFGKSALGYRNGLRVRIFGDKGAAEWVQTDPEFIWLSDRFGARSMIDRASPGVQVANQDRYSRFKPGHPAGFIEAFANYYYDLADSLEVRHGIAQHALDDLVYGLPTAMQGIKLLDAMARSARERQWITT